MFGNETSFLADIDGNHLEIIGNHVPQLWLLCSAASVAILLLLAIVLDLSNVSTVAGHGNLRGSGYFHLIAMLSVFNIIYFVFKLIWLLFDLLQAHDSLLQLPDFIQTFMDANEWLEPVLWDVTAGLIGLQILLLCVLTLEHRMNLSRHFYFKPRGQTCMRTFMIFVAFSLVIVSLAMSSMLRTTDLIMDRKLSTFNISS